MKMSNEKNWSELEVEGALEALIFASPEPISIGKLAQILDIHEEVVKTVLCHIKEKYDEDVRGLQLRELAGGYQISTKPQYAPYIEKLFIPPRASSLSSAALETLAIIAFKEPITKAEIEEIRGVKVDSVLSTLTERGLIEDVGRKDTIGRPLLYGTTSEFLKHFGFKSSQELCEIYQLSEGEEQGG
jgi:segregation and condensation protein B